MTTKSKNRDERAKSVTNNVSRVNEKNYRRSSSVVNSESEFKTRKNSSSASSNIQVLIIIGSVYYAPYIYKIKIDFVCLTKF